MGYRLLGLDSSIESAMFENFRTEFNNAFKISEAMALYKQLCTVIPSNARTETFNFGYLLRQMREFKDERQIGGIKVDDYSLTHTEYEDTVEVDRKDLDDDRLGIIRMAIAQMGTNAGWHPDETLGTLMNAHMVAGSSSAGFDGYPLWSASHAWVDGDYTTAQVNRYGTGSSKSVIDGTATGFTTIQNAIMQLQSFKWATGARIRTRPTHLFCSLSIEGFCRKHLYSSSMNYGADDESERGNLNPLYAYRSINVVPLPDLTAGYWFLADMSQNIKPFIFTDRIPLEFSNDDSDWFMRHKMRYGVYQRYGLGVGPWWLTVGGDGVA